MPGESEGGDALPENGSLSANRSRRQLKPTEDKFEKLRNATKNKAKNKYTVKPVENVYDMVDEDEYSRIVSERQLNDFVEADGAHTGYVENGLEIFDDELDDESLANQKRNLGQKNAKGKGKGKDKPDVAEGRAEKVSSDIRDWIRPTKMNVSKPKKQLTTADLADPTMLDDLLDELDAGPVSEVPTTSHTSLFLGSGKTVENVLADCHDDSLFSKTSLRKKKSTQPDMRQPSPPRFSSSTQDFDEPPAPPRNIKRALPESPAKPEIKKETLEEVRQSISAPKIIKFGETKSKGKLAEEAAQAKRMRAGGSPKNGPRVEWGDDKLDDFSNTSYEVDSLLDSEDMYTQMASMVLPDDVEDATKPPHRAQLPNIDKKWGNVDHKLIKSEDTQMDMDVQLAEVTSGGSQNSLRMYWLDAYEDPHHQPGCVFLFGKVLDKDGKTFVSACVKVTNIQRKLYFLKRDTRFDLDGENDADEEVTFQDLVDEYEELNICKKLTVKRFRERKMNYAFEKLDVPDQGVYLEARMPFSTPTLTKDFGETFSHVFGRNTSALEIFLLEMKLKGPCWLNLQNAIPSNPRFSWASQEYTVEYHSGGKCSVEIVPNSHKDSTPMVIMTIQLRIVVNARTKQNEIVAAAILIHRSYPLNKSAPVPLYSEHQVILTYPQELGSSMPRQVREGIKKNDRYNIQIVGKEQDLINVLLNKIKTADPDFLVFHDGLGYQLDILLQRAMQLKVGSWSSLGRLKRSIPPKGRTASQQACTGRLLCDVRRAAEELIHSKSYDLTELVKVVLKEENHQAIANDLVKEMFKTPERLKELVDNTLCDAHYILRLMAELNVLPLALEMTHICGNVYSRTLLGGRSERIEYHLLHAFTEAEYICPDKEFRDAIQTKDGKSHSKKKKKSSTAGKEVSKIDEGDEENVNPEDEHVVEVENDAALHDDVAPPTKNTGGKRKPAYSGGLVLEPKRGLYDTPILVMDFNSLYPSIIQEFNVCYTTVDRKSQANIADDNLPSMPSTTTEGILPKVIKRLVEQRKAVKKLLQGNNSDDRKAQLEIRQKALKLIANSTYGCLGFDYSRFRAKGLAALITSKGREILMNTKELIEKDRREVIYGDTDSIMINSHVSAENPVEKFGEVLKMGIKIKQEVNKHYKFLELDIDGIFFSMLLLQKKKYAALVASKNPDGSLATKQELKGLDIVRRDWSNIAIETGNFVVKEILSGKKRDEMISGILTVLGNVAKFVKDCPPAPNKVDLEKFQILKQLTKDPNLYADAKAHPHVQIARRLNSLTTTSQKCRAGDMIAYVVCNEVPSDVVVTGKRAPHTQRGYAIKEVMDAQGSLTVDKQYYLAEQVHKVVNRLCEPIEGIDSSTMADCLGIDKSLFPGHFVDRTAEDDQNMMGSVVPDSELYKDCLPLTVACPNCQENWVFDGPVWEKDGNYSFSLRKCLSCEQRPASFLMLLQNTLRIQLNVAMQRYYKVQFTCEDPACHFKCSFVPPKFSRGKPVCPACDNGRTFRIMKPEFSDRDLYLQLCYWKNAFDPERALNKMKNKSSYGSLMDVLKSDPQLVVTYEQLAKYVQTFLDLSAYGRVNFSDFFSPPANFMDNRAIKVEF